MSLNIKDLEMPKDCDSCRHPTCELWLDIDIGKRHPDCPLTEVPNQHGRLIDAEHLKESLEYYIREAMWGKRINMALDWVKDEFIDAEPTVIQASESEERPAFLPTYELTPRREEG